MPSRPKYLFATTAFLASPGVAAAIVLSGAGHLNPWLAALAVVAVTAAVMAIVYRPLARLHEIERRLDRLSDQPPEYV